MIVEHRDVKFEDVTSVTRVAPSSRTHSISSHDGILRPLYRKDNGIYNAMSNKAQALSDMMPVTYESSILGKVIITPTRRYYEYRPDKLENVVLGMQNLKKQLEESGAPAIAIPIFSSKDKRFSEMGSCGEEQEYTEEQMADVVRNILGDFPGWVNLIYEPTENAA